MWNEAWRVWLRQQTGAYRGRLREVATLAEVPEKTLRNYVTNVTRKPDVALLEQVARALDQTEQLAAALAGEPGPSTSGNFEMAEDAVPFAGARPAWPAKGPIDGGRWTAATRAVELAGVLPGDTVEFDFRIAPRPGDVVIAQLYGDDGSARTVLRIWRPPVLLVATADSTIDPAPIPLDETGATVHVRGPMVRLLRERR